jgi:hypothetical protein
MNQNKIKSAWTFDKKGRLKKERSAGSELGGMVRKIANVFKKIKA